MKLLNDLPDLCKLIYPDGARAYYESEGTTGGVLAGYEDDEMDRPYVVKHERAESARDSTSTSTTKQDNIRNIKRVADEAASKSTSTSDSRSASVRRTKKDNVHNMRHVAEV